SRYAFGQVELEAGEFGRTHRDLFDRYYALGEQLLASGLTLPALDHCLKCSHTFNLLDASGSIGVTERAAYILRVRKLAVAIAEAHAAWERGQLSGAGNGVETAGGNETDDGATAGGSRVEQVEEA
ncbi:MAG: glycine--tRNA ligase subunit alpha, partial [Acidobacteriota bacterium]|nr:glycine--tRNA ligase subunit alpha [Acidobacteriota bacterium]